MLARYCVLVGSTRRTASFLLQVSFNMKRLTIVGLLVTALLAGAVRLPAQSCVLSKVPSEKSCQQGCCANKTCCAEAEKNTAPPSQPLVKNNNVSHEFVAGVVSSLQTVVCELQSTEHSGISVTDRVAGSPPRLALLCTFLI